MNNKALHRSIPAIVSGKVGATQISVHVPGPNDHYINDLMRSQCFTDLLQTGYYPNAKELTESCAAFRASRKLDVDFNDYHVCCICVGDGVHPRTAAMFAFRTKWSCWSVDPLAKISCPQPVVKRCWQFAGPLKHFTANFKPYNEFVLACVHSHCEQTELYAFAAKLRKFGRVHIISIRCCEDDTLPKPPTEEYIDWGIWSPERRVRIWDNYFNGQKRKKNVIIDLSNAKAENEELEGTHHRQRKQAQRNKRKGQGG